MNVAVVIPAYNEEKTVREVVQQVRAVSPFVFVVDDGSRDATAQIAKQAGATLLQHVLNRGLGGALGTGIEAALASDADFIVTFDADGQHKAEDIVRVVEPLLLGRADVVIGSRMLNTEQKRDMPFLRRLYNWIGNRISYLLFGIQSTDSQSGLRAFTREAAGRLHLRANQMEVSTEIMYEIKRHHLRLQEVPIESIYTKYSMSKAHGQSLTTGIKTFFRLIRIRLLK